MSSSNAATTTWFNDNISSASNYDVSNFNALTNAIPAFIREDADNNEALTFTYMLGQHFDTEDFTIAIHDGPLAGQEIPHVHIHVIPRQQGDGGGSLPLMWPNRERFTSPPLKSLEALHESLTKT